MSHLQPIPFKVEPGYYIDLSKVRSVRYSEPLHIAGVKREYHKVIITFSDGGREEVVYDNERSAKFCIDYIYEEVKKHNATALQTNESGFIQSTINCPIP